MIYGEFSVLFQMIIIHMNFRKCEDILSDFIIGQLIMKLQYEFNKLQNSICEIEFYDNENIEMHFDLVSDQRYKVFNAIVNHISKFKDKIFFNICINVYNNGSSL